ncbi:GNAT family N-acetyltransferase [Flavobacterium sp. '19STA2R22 D10 B1']|uniref:GNAT family N-acetyltransferase n=1 Tax=Flavobacterium aerium TaxID=3037261 RepID=UPI00278C6458|nr:GNAT family N-acetyltransferase [Flavobacterium sp. '19STA2R22 D10 B1']
MKIISVREYPEYKKDVIQYLQNSWSDTLPVVYEDCLDHCIKSSDPLSLWYLVEHEGSILGCAGLIASDFTNETDFYPWKGDNTIVNPLDSVLLSKAKEYTLKAGFEYLYLCTDNTCWVL